jgi:hypothetical protein
MIFYVVTQDLLGSRGSQSDGKEANNHHLLDGCKFVSKLGIKDFKLILTVLIIFFSLKEVWCMTGELKLLCVSIPHRV